MGTDPASTDADAADIKPLSSKSTPGDVARLLKALANTQSNMLKENLHDAAQVASKFGLCGRVLLEAVRKPKALMTLFNDTGGVVERFKLTYASALLILGLFPKFKPPAVQQQHPDPAWLHQ